MSLPQDSRKLFAAPVSTHANAGSWLHHTPDPESAVAALPHTLTGQVDEDLAKEVTDHVSVETGNGARSRECESERQEQRGRHRHTQRDRNRERQKRRETDTERDIIRQ